jgi:outer membrane protein assembly factor BamA
MKPPARHNPSRSSPEQFCALRFLTAALCALSGCFLLASGAQAQAWKLGRVTISGDTRYTPEQILAASGLKAGQSVTREDLDAAAQRLSDSGAFADVTYNFAVAGGQVTVHFQVNDAHRFLRCVFDNLVWFSDEEIHKFLRREVPFFDGSIPDGAAVEQVTAALEALLQQRGIAARVEFIRQGVMGQKNLAALYRAAGVPLPMGKFRFPGASPYAAGQLARAIQQLFRRNYSRIEMSKFAEVALIPIYREHGFLRAKFAEPRAELYTTDSSEPAVSVTLPVVEGLEYAWRGAEWGGMQAFAAADLDRALGMHAYDRANGLRIDNGFETVEKLFRTKGYLDVQLRKEPVYDDAEKLVLFRVSITEGPQYRMGNFRVTGVSEEAAEKIRALWPLQPGAVFDASYEEKFLKGEVRRVLARAGGTAKNVALHRVPDRERHTVDVVLEIN